MFGGGETLGLCCSDCGEALAEPSHSLPGHYCFAWAINYYCAFTSIGGLVFGPLPGFQLSVVFPSLSALEATEDA